MPSLWEFTSGRIKTRFSAAVKQQSAAGVSETGFACADGNGFCSATNPLPWGELGQSSVPIQAWLILDHSEVYLVSRLVQSLFHGGILNEELRREQTGYFFLHTSPSVSQISFVLSKQWYFFTHCKLRCAQISIPKWFHDC